MIYENEKKKVIEWIKKYFEENGKNCKAVVGISGGTDSSDCDSTLCGSSGTGKCDRSSYAKRCAA